jgi:benzoyl-CoA-dihydrodiol lyase
MTLSARPGSRSTSSTSGCCPWSTARAACSGASTTKRPPWKPPALDADAALALGLVTAAPDDIDWDDEIRIAIEERAAMSPDALTGLEANLRFASQENMATRIFGRLTAWQNWIFNRPNAVGEKGALKVYGTGEKAGFDLNRV